MNIMNNSTTAAAAAGPTTTRSLAIGVGVEVAACFRFIPPVPSKEKVTGLTAVLALGCQRPCWLLLLPQKKNPRHRLCFQKSSRQSQ